MDEQQNYIERLKDELRDTDYISLKASEGCDCTQYGDWKAGRQALRDEINRIAAMAASEFAEWQAEQQAADTAETAE